MSNPCRVARGYFFIHAMHLLCLLVVVVTPPNMPPAAPDEKFHLFEAVNTLK